MASDPQGDLGLDASVRRALPLIFGGIGAFYVGLMMLVPWLAGETVPGPGLWLRWSTMALVGLGGAWTLQRWPAPAGWGNHLAGGLGLLVVSNSLLVIAWAGPNYAFALSVAVLAFSLFLLSLPWVIGIAGFCFSGLLFLAAQAGFGSEWAPRTVNLLAICTIAIIAQATRLRLHRRLGLLKAKDVQRVAQESQLAKERALADQRGRIVRLTAHELATPLTPVVVQAHLLAQEDLSPRQRQRVETLQRNLERLQAAIDKVVAAARADTATELYEESRTRDYATPGDDGPEDR